MYLLHNSIYNADNDYNDDHNVNEDSYKDYHIPFWTLQHLQIAYVVTR